jgi:hypothetical protein
MVIGLSQRNSRCHRNGLKHTRIDDLVTTAKWLF